MHTNIFKYTKQGSQTNPNAINKSSNHSIQVYPRGSPTSGDLGGLVIHSNKILKEIHKNNQTTHKKHFLKDWRPSDASKDATQGVASLIGLPLKCGSRGWIPSYLALLVVLAPEMPSKTFSSLRYEDGEVKFKRLGFSPFKMP